MFGWQKKQPPRRQRDLERQLVELQRQLADEQAAHEATQRRLTVAEAEIESLAAVLARDRERVSAESAGYARRRAEAEGKQHEQLD